MGEKKLTNNTITPNKKNNLRWFQYNTISSGDGANCDHVKD